MQDILVLGAGKIGALICGLLAESGDYHVQLGDAQPGAAADVAKAHGNENIRAFDIDATDKAALSKHVREHKPRRCGFQLAVLTAISLWQKSRVKKAFTTSI